MRCCTWTNGVCDLCDTHIRVPAALDSTSVSFYAMLVAVGNTCVEELYIVCFKCAHHMWLQMHAESPDDIDTVMHVVGEHLRTHVTSNRHSTLTDLGEALQRCTYDEVRRAANAQRMQVWAAALTRPCIL